MDVFASVVMHVVRVMTFNSVYHIFIQCTTRSKLFPYTTLFRSRCSSRSPGGPTAWVAPGRSPRGSGGGRSDSMRSEEHTSELQSLTNLVCRLLLEKKNSVRQCQREGGFKDN